MKIFNPFISYIELNFLNIHPLFNNFQYFTINFKL